MSYARFQAAAAEVEAFSGTRLKWKLRQAQAELRASLPFLGDDIFVLIATELDARMLGRLACAAPRFWRKSVADPTHKGGGAPELWSVAEEGARRRLVAHSEQVRGWVSRGGVGGSWLRALGEAEKLQRPLRWTARHVGLGLGHEGTVATRDGWGSGAGYRSAVCGGHEMRHGRHYATFTFRTECDAMLGVAGAGFDPTAGAQASDSMQGWVLASGSGSLWHALATSAWEGRSWCETELDQGDVVGMLLDCDAATLTVWVNGEWKGVMVRPGMTDEEGEPVGRLEGPLRWVVDVGDGSVAIEGPLPPPD